MKAFGTAGSPTFSALYAQASQTCCTVISGATHTPAAAASHGRNVCGAAAWLSNQPWLLHANQLLHTACTAAALLQCCTADAVLLLRSALLLLCRVATAGLCCTAALLHVPLQQQPGCPDWDDVLSGCNAAT